MRVGYYSCMGFFDKLKEIATAKTAAADSNAPAQVNIDANLKEAKRRFMSGEYPEMIRILVDCMGLPPANIEKIPSGLKAAFGSSKIEVRHLAESNSFIVDCHILDMPPGPKKMPLMRKLLEYNYQKTGLSRFSVEAGKIYLSFRDAVSYVTPEKLLDGIFEVARLADHYDNVLADEFGCAYAYPELAESQKRARRAEQEKHVKNILQTVKHFNASMNLSTVGNDGLCADLLCGLVYKCLVEFPASPALLNRLNAALEKVAEEKENAAKVAALKHCMDELFMRSWTEEVDFKGEVKETYRSCMEGSLPFFADDLQRKLQLIDALKKSSNFAAAYFLAEGTVYRLIYLVNPPPDVRKYLLDSLLESDKIQDYPGRVNMLTDDLSSLLRSLPVGQLAQQKAGHYGF